MPEENPDDLTTLLFTDPDDHKCSVFSVLYFDKEISQRFPVCEMYLKDSQVQNGPSTGCLDFFEKKCPGKIYSPYKAQCKNKGMEDTVYS
ncbi:hypothetical protein HPB50_017079 [Hyalomma asiaticum]|uniref:Uncharacterized protein n=1 Tax=Hyalomma asiaticum TaxID=266040 RepID=A0ACB7RPL1_HYAAI|nr:hypothetical protein HPB50_017079 [Hyalomma asiaticum]